MSLVVMATVNCRPNEPHEGIYYWKTTWAPGQDCQNEALEHGMDRVYLRLFDLDVKQGKIEDRGRILLPNYPGFSDSLGIVPVIFLTNRVWQNGPAPAVVAQALLDRADHYFKKHPALLRSGELQIDCDWTAPTRDAYFEMLRAVKNKRPELEISVTIRLHQYRERTENGVPPADRGLLMCYNLAPANKWETKDGIFDIDLLKGYLKAPDYPLPLDAALPLFKWGAAFRGQEFLGLTDHPMGWPERSLDLRGNQVTLFTLNTDTIIGPLFLRPGDRIRGDGIQSAAKLDEAKALLVDKIAPRYRLDLDSQPGALDLLD